MPDSVPTLDDKIRLVARSIYDAVHINNTTVLTNFQPSHQVHEQLSDSEYQDILRYLIRHQTLSINDPLLTFTRGIQPMPPNISLMVNVGRIQELLGIRQAEPNEPYEFNPTRGTLRIGAVTITASVNTLQYHVLQSCLARPGAAIREASILARYRPDYDITARGRAVRDAVSALNRKAESASGIHRLFIYSRGTVSFDPSALV